MFNKFWKFILSFINVLWILFLMLMIIVLYDNAKLTCLFLFMCIIVSSYSFWIKFIKNENFNIKFKIRLPIIIILFILSGTFTPSNSDEGDKFLIPEEHGIVDIENIQSYEFGNELTSVLNQIGISNMGKSSFEVVNERTITIRMNIDDLRVWIALNKDYYDDVWKVEFIKNYDDKEYVYYLDDEQKYINGLLKQNIYSFPDNVIIEKVDENSLNQYYAELEKQNQQRKKEQQEKEKQAEQQKRLDAVNIIDEIYNAYDNNELKADELYKGKEYLILGKFDGASDDGLFNNLLKEVSVSIIVEHPNRNYILSCSFDKELWRDKILTLNKGDEIFIKGECYSWGVWSNCSIEE